MNEKERIQAEELKELRNSNFWGTLCDIRDAMLEDLNKKFFLPVHSQEQLIAEPQLGQILAARFGTIRGVQEFFQLIEKKIESLKFVHKKGGTNGN